MAASRCQYLLRCTSVFGTLIGHVFIQQVQMASKPAQDAMLSMLQGWHVDMMESDGSKPLPIMRKPPVGPGVCVKTVSTAWPLYSIKPVLGCCARIVMVIGKYWVTFAFAFKISSLWFMHKPLA